MSLLKWYVIDTETTGLSNAHEINQISLIRCEDKFQKTVNIAVDHPERADSRALEIQKKTRLDLKTGIKKEEAVEIIEQYILNDDSNPENRIFVGHNVAFDRRFLKNLWASVNKTFPGNLWLCTKTFMNKYAKSRGIVKPKLTLEASLILTGVKTVAGSAHNAVVDTKNTYLLWEYLMAQNLGHLPLIKVEPHRLIKQGTQDDAEIFEDF